MKNPVGGGAAALETPGPNDEAKELVKPGNLSNNGSGYISKEFRDVLTEHDPAPHRIRPHCPEENATTKPANQTLRE